MKVTFLNISGFVLAGLLLVAGTEHAQTALLGNLNNDLAPVRPDSIVQVVADSQGLQLVPPEQVPAFGTFWWVVPGGAALPTPCPPPDLSGAIYQIADGQFLVDETGGQVVVKQRRLGLQAQVTSSIVASAAVSQADSLINLITQVQTASESQEIQTLSQAMSLDVPIPGDGSADGTGTNSSVASSYTLPDYGTNLWIAQIAVTSGYLTAIATNTEADIPYEIQSRTNLQQTDWQSEGFINGSELTNWTPLTVWQGSRANFFIRLRSWADSDDLGIPDWWQLEYFGTIGIDPYASAAGDGYSNLQKFQMGLNPTNYYNPNTPGGFFGSLDASGTNAIIYWNSMSGAVNYLVQRGVLNLNGNYAYTQFLVSSNATWFEDVGAITDANAQNDIYTLQAVFPGGSLSGTNTWRVSWYANWASYGPPYGPPPPGEVYANMDSTGTNIQVSWTPAQGAAINYLVERGTNFNSAYIYSTIAQVGAKATFYEDIGALTNTNYWESDYAVAAIYPGGGLSCAVPSYSMYTRPISLGANTNGPAAPTNFWGYTDWIYYPWEAGTNVFLIWGASPGAVGYILYGGNWDDSTVFFCYQTIGQVTGTSFELAGGTDGNGNYTYISIAIVAVYADGSLSQSAYWDPGDGAPAPSLAAAYVDVTGTNVEVAWSPVPEATGYSVQRSDCNNNFYEIAETDSSTTSYLDVDEVDNANLYGYGLDNVSYQVAALFPNGGYSAGAKACVSNTPPAPTGLTATVDSTGTNVLLSWSPAIGLVTGYTILCGTYNPNTGQYSFSQIGTTGAGTTSFENVGAITSRSHDNDVYEVEAVYGNSYISDPDASNLSGISSQASSNVSITAQLVRNENGRWQLMFSSIPTNVPTVAFYWYLYDYFYDFSYPDTGDDCWHTTEVDIPVRSLTNGIYVIPDFLVTNWIPDNYLGKTAMIQPIGTNNEGGNISQVGFLPSDAPCWVDGRQHLKQNLLFKLRAATISQPNSPLTDNNVWVNPWYENIGIPADTNYVESSIFHYAVQCNGFDITGDNLWYIGSAANQYIEMDDLWPITANYQLHPSLYDTNYTGPASFVWQTNLVTVPAPAVLGVGDPYWISQDLNNPGDVGASTNGGMFSVSAGAVNLYGLPFAPALVNQGSSYWFWDGTEDVDEITPIITVAPGSSTALTNVNCLFSQTADPDLRLTDYYFAPVNTPGTALAQFSTPIQPYPLPAHTGFANTNQTGIMVASVGNPTVIGGWAKFSIHNGSAGKFAYLGQYFVTNAFLLDTNGNLTTNTTGVVSPYGDFFPTEPGTAAMVTMPDNDQSYEQGTGVVRVIALNADVNHDGTMDFTYTGPDFVSASKPFRFWVDDSTDSGDYTGTGIPGRGAQGNGLVSIEGQWQVHGRRDLVNLFPVCINIGSLFQSNALSAGISVWDTNYQFVLSQADSALRFAYTDLMPTNYMNFLQDTNESGELANANLITITAAGVPLSEGFLNGIAIADMNIILVEATIPTTQPLVLTIYHGTNQIAQTSLPISITGVEQMFRSKTMMLNPTEGTVPDRLTDTDVPNEPDTIAKNFVFMHGYNVLPDEARGVAADMFKRMYWSGSHAKFWAVTWEGADTKGTFPFYNKLTPNYHTNVVNAFLTAPNLANFVATLTNSGPVVVAAHSLGNMVTLSAISDSNAPISQYFMLDAAVPIEAIDSSSSTNVMIYSTWMAYSNRVFAGSWYKLFPTNDARSTLNWNNRLGNLHNVDVYNFYSSGEEVLREYDSDPPTSFLDIVETQASARWPSGVPFGGYAWVWQEKGKGTCNQDWLIGSSHGGWLFPLNSYNDPQPLPPATANALSNATLEQTPVFTFGSYYDAVSGPFPDWALLGSNGSAYAAANRNRILSDAIPAISLPVGANPVPKLSPPISPVEQNFNMNTLQFQNGWSQCRTGDEQNKWHHSDFVQMAYTFTYKLFNQFVTTGNLK